MTAASKQILTLCLGLVGGIGPPSTVFYYQSLVAACAAQGVQPRLLIVHADIDRVLGFAAAQDNQGLADYLASFIDQLARAGADIAAVGAVTAHLCMPQLAPISPLPLVDIITSLTDELERRGMRRLALLGTRFAMQARLFGRLEAFDLIDLTPAQIDEVHRIYLTITANGQPSPADAAIITDLARDLCEGQGAEAVILAGTELSLAFPQETAGFPVVDCARLHIADLVARMTAGA